ncbi:hypothetical protein [Nannocystis pusilla]|uniref:hypothetical protein n=1 Tax=Nannocystis pusilla TaxID=889268 RepID=UPI003B81E731
MLPIVVGLASAFDLDRSPQHDRPDGEPGASTGGRRIIGAIGYAPGGSAALSCMTSSSAGRRWGARRIDG